MSTEARPQSEVEIRALSIVAEYDYVLEVHGSRPTALESVPLVKDEGISYADMARYLRDVLPDTEPDIAVAVAAALMRDDRPNVGTDAGCVTAPLAIRLYELGNPAALDLLADLLNHQNPSVVDNTREEAIKTIAKQSAESQRRAELAAGLMKLVIPSVDVSFIRKQHEARATR